MSFPESKWLQAVTALYRGEGHAAKPPLTVNSDSYRFASTETGVGCRKDTMLRATPAQINCE